MVTVTVAPAAIVPIVHVTSLGVTSQLPTVDVAPVAVTSDGKTSVATTPRAVEGPRFDTVTV